MSDPCPLTLSDIEESERDILRRIDGRLERIDRRIAEGADYLTELRTEVEITRISYEHQLELTRRLVELAVS
jgi:hypothetical protein